MSSVITILVLYLPVKRIKRTLQLLPLFILNFTQKAHDIASLLSDTFYLTLRSETILEKNDIQLP